VIRFCSLGSGSTGNATLVEASGGITTTRLLIDAGFSLRELETRLERAGLEPRDVDAVFVTHEHSDHVGCALAFAERHGAALWMSRGTWRAIGAAQAGVPARLGVDRDGETIALGDLELRPFTVAHDAAEPLQLRCSDGNACLGVLTDLGSITEHMLDGIRGCDALVLECNHDEEMLAGSRYPPSLKARIGGRYGHLSNARAVELLATGVAAKLRHLVGAHLSRENNRPDIVRGALAACWGSRPEDVVIADPLLGCAWLQVG
jgi:phosphoribosyl 1,2-cyclic phosphodiesterase